MIRWVVMFVSLACSSAAAEYDIVLKSGARAKQERMGIIQAPAKLGGPAAGNVIELSYSAKNWSSNRLHTDAKSLCLLYAQRKYKDAQKQPPKDIAILKQLGFDLSADLVGAKIMIRSKNWDTSDTGINVSLSELFDMRGLVKCRNLGK